MALRVWNSVQFNAVTRKLQRIVNHYPGNHGLYYITSGHRPHTPNSHHGGRLSYGGSPTSAIDIGFNYNGTAASTARGRVFAEWLHEQWRDTVELIHVFGPTGTNGTFIKNQRQVGPYAVSTHRDHIHFAASSALADRILARLEPPTPPTPPTPPAPKRVAFPPASGW